MKRRGFITLAGSAIAAWPLLASARQRAIPVVAFLRTTPSAPFAYLVTALREGLKEVGFVDGANVVIEQHWTEGKNDRLEALTTEMVGRKPDVVVANNLATRVAKVATTTIPIVFASGSDPVHEGLVTSLNRPGGNVTGVFFFGAALGAKRVELLRQLMPKATPMGLLTEPNNPTTAAERSEVLSAAQAAGQQLISIGVTNSRDIEAAFSTFVQHGVGALLIGGGAFINSNRERIVALVTLHKLPSSFPWREATMAGGLMSYGTSQSDAYRQAGIYAGRILKGEKPGDLPVTQATKFEFVLNVKTAKALGIDIPDRLLALADEVIE